MPMSLGNLLTCSICMEIFVCPRVLPCQHMFCETCLVSYVKDQRQRRYASKKLGHVSCPVCRKRTKLGDAHISGFPRSYIIQALVESNAHRISLARTVAVTTDAETQTTEPDHVFSIPRRPRRRKQRAPANNGAFLNTHKRPTADMETQTLTNIDQSRGENVNLSIVNRSGNTLEYFIMLYLVGPLILITESGGKSDVFQKYVHLTSFTLCTFIYIKTWNVLSINDIYICKIVLIYFLYTLVRQLCTFRVFKYTFLKEQSVLWPPIRNRRAVSNVILSELKHVLYSLVFHVFYIGSLITTAFLGIFMLTYINNARVLFASYRQTQTPGPGEWHPAQLHALNGIFLDTTDGVFRVIDGIIRDLANSQMEQILRTVFGT